MLNNEGEKLNDENLNGKKKQRKNKINNEKK